MATPTSTLPASSRTPVKPDLIGAGFLFHLVPQFTQLYQQFTALGGQIDMIEYLATHFAPDPEYIAEVNRSMGDPPSSLHCYEYMIGSVDRPTEAVTRRLRRMVELSNCQYIGEHVGIMGTTGVYTGSFLQPFGTDEQTERFIENLLEANELAGCPVIIENQSQIYNQIGPRSVCEQIRDVAVAADTGILLSLSNFVIAEKFFPMDREREMSVLPLDRVWQVHLPLGNEDDLRQPEHARDAREQDWAYSTLEQLCKEESFRPASIVFEIEDAGTPTLAKPEQLRDALDWARNLLGKELTA